MPLPKPALKQPPKPPVFSRLKRLIRMPAMPAHEQDPADMGTAIGLEYTLDQPALHHSPPAKLSAPAQANAPRPWYSRR